MTIAYCQFVVTYCHKNASITNYDDFNDEEIFLSLDHVTF
jgi:hypothetical protein